jgi:hypothetical protein
VQREQKFGVYLYFEGKNRRCLMLQALQRIGLLWAGHCVRVLARSTNWRWWCIRWGRRTAWVSADPHLTRPLHW